MGGIVSSIFGGDDSAKKARRAQAAFDAQESSRLAELRKTETEAERQRAKKKLRVSGTRRSILTSPLGIQDTLA